MEDPGQFSNPLDDESHRDMTVDDIGGTKLQFSTMTLEASDDRPSSSSSSGSSCEGHSGHTRRTKVRKANPFANVNVSAQDGSVRAVKRARVFGKRAISPTTATSMRPHISSHPSGNPLWTPHTHAHSTPSASSFPFHMDTDCSM
eukprot:GFYU01002523.1.p1 GENE.GFYU01002523.1~~GFYU01002523.1.p1  ORF type:complete len:145 (-),score=9.30 GFYU01002523.1:319-753(-)